MCFVNKNKQFLGCMNLTTATVVMGILLIIKGLVCTIMSNFINIYTIVFGVFCVYVACRTDSIKLRSILVIMFWIEIVLLFINIAMYIPFIIFVDKIYDCDNDFNNTCDTVRTILYVGLAINITLGVIIDVMVGQVVINGKKELIEKKGEKASKPQKPQQPMQPGQQMYPTVPQQQVQMGSPQQPQQILIQQQTIPAGAHQNIVIAGEPVAVVDPEAAAFDKANNV